MRRFLSLLAGDIAFQKKYGFYVLYLFFTVLYTVLVYVLPDGWRHNATSVVVFSDPALLGLIFIGAIVLYEKSERVIDSLSASPVRIGEYVLSKGVSLGIISTLCGSLIALFTGADVAWPVFLAGLFFGSCMFTFTGLAISTRISNFNQFIVWLIPICELMSIPAVLYKFWLPSPWWMFHPGAAAYNLIDGGMGYEWLAAVSLAVWLVLTFLYARSETAKMFRSLGGAKRLFGVRVSRSFRPRAGAFHPRLTRQGNYHASLGEGKNPSGGAKNPFGHEPQATSDMSALGVSFKMLARQVKDDKISAVMVGFPIVVALLLYFLAPMVSDGLVAGYGTQWDLHRLYPMFDAIMVAFAIITPGYAAVMVMMGEIDERVTPSLCASPLGRGGYLFSRLGLPTLFSLAVAFVLCFTLNLAGLPAPMYVTVILVTLIADTLPSMIVVAFARNKVEGVALFKIAIFATFVILVPFFVDSWVQWLFSPLPSFWIGKLVKEMNYLCAIPAVLTSLAWLIPLWRRFMKKI